MSASIEVDGAHEGVRPAAAMKSVIGGEPLAPGDRTDLRTLEADIRAVPLPDSKEPLFSPEDEPSEEDYNKAAMCLAHCYLILVSEGVPLISEGFYTQEEVDAHLSSLDSISEDERSAWSGLVGLTKEPDHILYEKVKDRWPNFAEFAGGITGFQSGWAYNAIRVLKGEAPASNPAIVDINL